MTFFWGSILGGQYSRGVMFSWAITLVGGHSRGMPLLADDILVAQYSCGVLFS